MGWLDHEVLTWVNGWAGRSAVADGIVYLVADNALLKGGPFMAACWWIWFRRPAAEPEQRRDREAVLATLVAAFVALCLARSLVVVLPFRPRPLHDPAIQVRAPLGVSPGVYERWSSLPSDHATLFVALAVGLWFAWPKLGACLFIYALLGISLSRIYFGIHYPSDILAGAGIGLLCAVLANMAGVRRALAAPLLRSAELWPGLFYAALFLLTFEFATLFDASRQLLGHLRQLFGAD